MSFSPKDVAPCFDVVIIGGGPAGTSAALTLLKRQDISVLVLEAGAYDKPRAGESLSPGISALIEYLDIRNLFADLRPIETWGNQAAWGSEDLGCFDFIFNIHGHGWSIDRTRFEHMLANQVNARGGRVETHARCCAIKREGDLWHISVNDGHDDVRKVHARCVIDTAGRTSRWSDATRHRHDDLVGISALLHEAPSEQKSSVTTVETCEDGWWYAAPVPGKKLAVSFMSDTDIIHRGKHTHPDIWVAALRKTQYISRLVSLPSQHFTLRTDPAFSACLVPESNMDIIPAGDAAASFDPLSSSGIPHAFATGIQAARVASDRLHGQGQLARPYADAIAKDFRQYLRTRWRIYAMEKRFPNATFWQRRQTAVTLPPDSILIADPMAKNLGIFLPRQVADEVILNAQAPITAADLVEHIGNHYPTYPAERIILGIQSLIGQGLTIQSADADIVTA